MESTGKRDGRHTVVQVTVLWGESTRNVELSVQSFNAAAL